MAVLKTEVATFRGDVPAGKVVDIVAEYVDAGGVKLASVRTQGGHEIHGIQADRLEIITCCADPFS